MLLQGSAPESPLPLRAFALKLAHRVQPTCSERTRTCTHPPGRKNLRISCALGSTATSVRSWLASASAASLPRQHPANSLDAARILVWFHCSLPCADLRAWAFTRTSTYCIHVCKVKLARAQGFCSPLQDPNTNHSLATISGDLERILMMRDVSPVASLQPLLWPCHPRAQREAQAGRRQTPGHLQGLLGLAESKFFR